MSSSSQIGGKDVQCENKGTSQILKHIHIGVFFDGTGNNMVRKMVSNHDAMIDKKHVDINKDINKLYSLCDDLRRASYLYALSQAVFFASGGSSIVLKKNRDKHRGQIESLKKQINDLSVKINTTETQLAETVDDNGHTNIAVLYSLFNCNYLEKEKYNEPSKATKFYIQGSGMTDMIENDEDDYIGLGLGLNKCGVTALVSKAISCVTNYVENLKSSIDDSTKVHFYVFGFSRGATCGRLFTHIATRKVGDKLKVREAEFAKFIQELMDNGRVKFLEDIDKLKWNNIMVDFLGIYDTVASIGVLRQKDGEATFLRHIARLNWHYKNVTQYGLYLCKDTKKLLKVCHIGALDEYRENFAFTNIGREIQNNAMEILIPGCHADVGGGYMSGLEQEISLPFYTKKNDEELRTKLLLKNYHKKPSDNYLCSPENPIPIGNLDSKSLGVESLEYVGWIESSDLFRKEKERVAESENEVEFQREVERGWSDVALLLMCDICNKTCGSIFNNPVIYDYKYTITDNQVKELGEKVVNSAKSMSWGKRYWVIPGGSISSEEYRHLRLRYIHFTATNFTVTNRSVSDSPNFDLSGNLCRITYNGDKIKELEDNTDDNAYSEHVHYIYDLESSNIIVPQ